MAYTYIVCMYMYSSVFTYSEELVDTGQVELLEFVDVDKTAIQQH